MNLFKSNYHFDVWYTCVRGCVYFWSVDRKKWVPTNRSLAWIRETSTLVGKQLHMTDRASMSHIKF